MSATINDIDCDFLRGELPQSLDGVSQRWHVPGTEGEGILLLGKRGAPCPLVAVLYDTKANVASWHQEIRAVEGQIVTVENDWGDTQDLYVEKVHPLLRTAAKTPGEEWECRGEVKLDCVYTGVLAD